jgi:hypothetical protein
MRRIPEIPSFINGVFASKIFFPLESPPKNVVFSKHFPGLIFCDVLFPPQAQWVGGTTRATIGASLGLVMASRMAARGAVLTKSMPAELELAELAPFGVETIPSWAQRAGRSYWTGASLHAA